MKTHTKFKSTLATLWVIIQSHFGEVNDPLGDNVPKLGLYLHRKYLECIQGAFSQIEFFAGLG